MFYFYYKAQMKFKDLLKKTKNFFSKLGTRFKNYRNTKKRFVLYLFVLAFFLLVFPVIHVATLKDSWGSFWLWGFWKSLFVILIALAGLLCWNLSVSFKNWATKLFALREDEPLVDFLLLWIMVSVFMWMMDGASISSVSWVSDRVNLTSWAIIDCLLLLGWLVWAFISLLKTYNKWSKKTRIVNVVDENHAANEPKKNAQVTHLFDDLGEE